MPFNIAWIPPATARFSGEWALTPITAFLVLETANAWKKRPPVVVFVNVETETAPGVTSSN